jgi:lanthanide-dependent methanol dehydrogenase
MQFSKLVLTILILTMLVFSLSCKQKAESEQSHPTKTITSPTGATQTNTTEDGSWPMAAKNYESTRYSQLNQINSGNVRNLKTVWTFSTGLNRGHEAAPLVIGGTMYIVTPYPNVLYALDLNQGGNVKWKYEPKPAPASQGVACCDVVNRGAAYSNGKVFINTLDGFCAGVNAETGQEIWKTKLGEINKGETITMAPLVVKGKVLVGNSGGEFGVRGWLTALDENSGQFVWKAYSTGPDKDVLIGPKFHPYYPQDRGKDLGVSTWPPDQWKIGGGTVWGWISYDPELNLIYYGTANPGPWNHEARPGDNKWTAGIFARDPDTGEAIWFYQMSPHDLYDHDGVNENILLQIPWQGKQRKVLVHPDRNGYVYVLDRQNGQVLSAQPFVTITASKGVDLKSGKLIPVKEKEPKTGVVVREICPSASGGKDWQPASFAANMGLIYIPHQNLCMDNEGIEANYIEGTPYVAASVRFYAGPGGYRGAFTAWDPVNQKIVWSLHENFPVWSGALTTAGNIAFYGTMEGWFKAVDVHDGKLLWQFKTGSGIIGQPITYLGPDGKQYVAVFSGVGGWAGAIVAGDLDPRDPTAAIGFVGAMRDLPSATTKGGMLYVFSL